MKPRVLDIAALAAAVAILLGSVLSMFTTRPDPGIHLAYWDGQVVIGSIDYASMASEGYYGLNVGDVVLALDWQDISSMPAAEKQWLVGQPWSWLWIATESGSGVLAVPVDGAGQVSSGVGNDRVAVSWYLGRDGREGDLMPIGLGLAILGLGWWWLGSGRGGAGLKRYAVTLPVATAMPILVLPLNRLPTLAAGVIGSGLVAAAMLPLAFDLACAVPERRRRLTLMLLASGLAVAATAVGILVPMDNWFPPTYVHSLVRAALVAMVPLIPGIPAAGPMNWLESEPDGPHGGIFASPELIVAALTPGVAAVSLVPLSQYFPWPILSWLAVIVVARRLRRPATRLAARATHQRDLVVAATEAERARIAADVHDDALQDLTMLVRRLDAAGDTANAQAAREIAERLRAVVGDLRLPVLDDLGIGPSLEWLCDRLDSPAGSVTLDRLPDESRQPADVELAVFRIAQEALSNAIRHGKAPIIVRYVTGPDWVELEIDDSGSGIPAGAAELAEQTGHLGLMNMAQRAEAIGASLKIGRRPGGGTRVALIWERAGAPGAATSAAPSTSTP